MNVGWNVARSAIRFLTSLVCPSTEPPMTTPTWIIRANTCASGRKSSVEAPSSEKRLASVASRSRMLTTLAASKRKLPWVSSQPLGRPVVPDV